MEAKELVTAMADLFEKSPDRWSISAMSRDVSGNIVDPMADNAYSFSVHGFLERSKAEGLVDAAGLDQSYSLLIDACKLRGNGDVTLVSLNDVLGREALVATARLAAA